MRDAEREAAGTVKVQIQYGSKHVQAYNVADPKFERYEA